MTTRSAIACLILALFILILPACSDDDDDPVTPPGPTYEDPVLQAMVEEGAFVAQGMVDLFPGVVTGALFTKDAIDPYWDESCTCWRWSIFEENYGGPGDSWYRGWNFAATFYKDEVPQMDPEGADRVSLQINYSANESSYTDEMNNFYRDYHLTMTVQITMLGEGVFEIDGSGTGGMSAYAMDDGVPSEVYEEFTTSLYLTYPLGQCPTGMLTIDFDPASFSVSFSSEGVAYWDYQVGPGEPTTGSFNLTCGD